MSAQDLPARLELALKVLSISRGRLAAELGVDKSVIGRWLSGAHAPSGHNMANLTDLVAARRPGFTLLDWEADLPALSAKLGIEAAPASPWGPLAGWLPEQVLSEAKTMTALRGEAYEGFWRTTRPAISDPGRFIHDQLLIRRSDFGFLTFRLGIEDMRFEGWAFITQTQLFAVGADARTGMFNFSIFNAVLRHRAEVMDGLSLGCQRVGGGSPVAVPVVMERRGFLTGDAAADDAAYEASITPDALAPEGSVPKRLRDHLFRDFGPTALAAGGMAVLTMAFASSISRGPLLPEQIANEPRE